MVCDQVDVVGKSNHMLAVPMLSLTLEWAAKLKGNQLAQPLSELLADCCHRLRTHFAQFIMDRVGTSHRALPRSLLLIVLKATCFPSTVQQVLLFSPCRQFCLVRITVQVHERSHDAAHHAAKVLTIALSQPLNL